ncbi:MAG: dephospho-CoA kinase [Bacteroidota bacterium]
MSIVVGITGGIGSGKTTIASIFEDLGVPVYNADDEAKKLMVHKNIKSSIVELLGDQSYSRDQLNKSFIRAAIFNDDEMRLKINTIVHPEVAKHFTIWLADQNSPYVLKEAAIIFEAGLVEQYDYIITVVADEELRINRVLNRPGLDHESVKAIINKQWSDEEKMTKSDFVITNNDLDTAKEQALQIHSEILEKLNERKF